MPREISVAIRSRTVLLRAIYSKIRPGAFACAQVIISLVLADTCALIVANSTIYKRTVFLFTGFPAKAFSTRAATCVGITSAVTVTFVTPEISMLP
jgi:hypothetical protein